MTDLISTGFKLLDESIGGGALPGIMLWLGDFATVPLLSSINHQNHLNDCKSSSPFLYYNKLAGIDLPFEEQWPILHKGLHEIYKTAYDNNKLAHIFAPGMTVPQISPVANEINNVVLRMANYAFEFKKLDDFDLKTSGNFVKYRTLKEGFDHYTQRFVFTRYIISYRCDEMIKNEA